ncbi:MAG TPA: sensor/response regulator hybrid protein [Janthinobacterium sp.]|nr:sensor/response regulator hybrid protein [Janthinobacterium sp.]
MNPANPSGGDAGAIAGPRSVLDIEDGLERIMGDRALYFKLLRRFQHDHHSTPRQIRDALSAGLYDNARLRAHTLKGAAGMIGANAVYALATTLDAALRAQASALDPQLGQLESALGQLLSTVDSVLPDVSEHHVAAATDPAGAPALDLLARLATLLREGDGAAIDLLDHSATALAASLGLNRYQEVAAAAHEFDFDGALRALTRPR